MRDGAVIELKGHALRLWSAEGQMSQQTCKHVDNAAQGFLTI